MESNNESYKSEITRIITEINISLTERKNQSPPSIDRGLLRSSLVSLCQNLDVIFPIDTENNKIICKIRERTMKIIIPNAETIVKPLFH
jgi:hypothetical protein